MNSKKFPIWAVLVLVISIIVAIVGLSFIGPYNKIIALEETVEEKQGNIQSQLQARIDKINEMVPVVSAVIEKDKTLTSELDDLQASLNGSSSITPGASLSQLEKVDDLSSLVLKDLTRSLQSQNSSEVISDYLVTVEGIENRISVARMRYNEAVSQYNSYIRRFPHNIVAGLFGFEPKQTFSAETK